MTSKQPSIVIVGAARTPMGSFLGAFKEHRASILGAAAIKAAVDRAKLTPNTIEEVLMGCVLPAGQGQAPARQAALGAGLPVSAGCTTVNKMCGSGMKTVMLAHDLILAGSAKIIVAGGMENMTRAPYLLPKARVGIAWDINKRSIICYLMGWKMLIQRTINGFLCRRLRKTL